MGIAAGLGRIAGRTVIAKEAAASKWAATKEAAGNAWDKVSNPRQTLDSIKSNMQNNFQQGMQQARENTAANAQIAAQDAQQKVREKERKEDLKDKEKDRKEFAKQNKDFTGSIFHTQSEHGLGLFVFIAIIVHIIDSMQDFARPGYLVIAGYGILLIIMGFTSRGKIRDMGQFLAVTAIAYALPWGYTFFFDMGGWKWVVGGLVILLPILPIYLSFQMPRESKWRKFVVFYIALWLVLGLLWMLTEFNTTPSTATIQNPGKLVSYVFAGVGKIISDTGANMGKSFRVMVAQATGERYEGEEENSRGIMLENVKPLEVNYYTDSNILVYADIKAQNIQEPVRVRSGCFIPSLARKGTITANEELILMNNDYNKISCDLGKITTEGFYEIKFISTFTYKTDADIAYFFIDRNKYLEIEREKKDVNAALDIPKESRAIYTGGPAELGLPKLTQPLRINLENPNDIQYTFGVSLINTWTKGKIVRGISYKLEVPSSVELEKCSRTINNTYTKDGVTVYVFTINDLNAREAFDSVSCFIKITDPAMLLGNDLYSQKTFSARAEYEYAVEESTNIEIKKWSGRTS